MSSDVTKIMERIARGLRAARDTSFQRSDDWEFIQQILAPDGLRALDQLMDVLAKTEQLSSERATALREAEYRLSGGLRLQRLGEAKGSGDLLNAYERLEIRLMDALSDRDRARQEVKTLTAAIERYADTLILDQPLDETSPLNRAVVAHDLRAFVNFAANGGLLATGESRLAERRYESWLESLKDHGP